jgi:hypothetical protein
MSRCCRLAVTLAAAERRLEEARQTLAAVGPTPKAHRTVGGTPSRSELRARAHESRRAQLRADVNRLEKRVGLLTGDFERARDSVAALATKVKTAPYTPAELLAAVRRDGVR